MQRSAKVYLCNLLHWTSSNHLVAVIIQHDVGTKVALANTSWWDCKQLTDVDKHNLLTNYSYINLDVSASTFCLSPFYQHFMQILKVVPRLVFAAQPCQAKATGIGGSDAFLAILATNQSEKMGTYGKPAVNNFPVKIYKSHVHTNYSNKLFWMLLSWWEHYVLASV